MQPLPNQGSPFVKLPSGLIIPPWNSYLQQFTQAPPAITLITVGASPFSYRAVEPGYLSVIGGTVITIQLVRGSFSVYVAQTLVPMGIADTVIVIYSVTPNINFIPMYGNAPR